MPWLIDQPVPPAPIRVCRRLSRRASDNARQALSAVEADIFARRALRPASAPPTEPMQRPILSNLPAAECLRLLGSSHLGRLAFIGRLGVPLIVPVNYELGDDTIFIRTGPGPKLQAAERQEMVSLEVDDIDQVTRSGWSVVVTGRASRVSDERILIAGGPWTPGPRRHVLRIDNLRISGRRLSSGDESPGGQPQQKEA